MTQYGNYDPVRDQLINAAAEFNMCAMYLVRPNRFKKNEIAKTKRKMFLSTPYTISFYAYRKNDRMIHRLKRRSLKPRALVIYTKYA